MSIGTNTDRDAAASELAAAHFQVDPSIERIFRVIDPDPEKERRTDEPIKLLEVNPETIASGIQPVYFGPDASHGMLFPSVIIEIHPDEYEALEQGSLSLPDGCVKSTEHKRGAGE